MSRDQDMRDDGAALERERIVKWLRNLKQNRNAQMFANAIEAGKHVPVPSHQGSVVAGEKRE